MDKTSAPKIEKKTRRMQDLVIRPYTQLLVGLSAVLIIFSVILNYYNSLRFVRDQELDNSLFIKNEILHFLDTPFKLNQQNLDLYKIGVIQNLSPAEIRKLFTDQYAHSGKLTLVGMGLEGGTYIDVQYLNDSDLYSSERNPVTGINRGWRTDKDSQIISLERTSNYDHRVRPWYANAKNNEEKKATWTPIYISINPKSLFLTATQPIYDDSQEFQGTMVSSISLTEIGNIIRSFHSLGTRQIYILERDGKVVASTQHKQPFLENKGDLKRVDVAESQDAVLSTVIKSNHIDENSVELMLIDYNLYFVGSYSINDHRGIDWQIVIANPAYEMLREIGYRTLLILLLAFITIGIGIWIGRRIGVYISEPILDIKNAADQIVQGDLKQRVKVRRGNEIGEMADSFNQMGDTIHDLVNKLEEKVRERTGDLEASKQTLVDKNSQLERVGTALEEKNLTLKEKNNALQNALDEIKVLKGLVPICANCKKIRDDKGYWNHLEAYIEKHSEAQFSHGICEECADLLYGDSKWYQNRNSEKE